MKTITFTTAIYFILITSLYAQDKINPNDAPKGCRLDYGKMKYVCLDGRIIDPNADEDKNIQDDTTLSEKEKWIKKSQNYINAKFKRENFSCELQTRKIHRHDGTVKRSESFCQVKEQTKLYGITYEYFNDGETIVKIISYYEDAKYGYEVIFDTDGKAVSHTRHNRTPPLNTFYNNDNIDDANERTNIPNNKPVPTTTQQKNGFAVGIDLNPVLQLGYGDVDNALGIGGSLNIEYYLKDSIAINVFGGFSKIPNSAHIGTSTETGESIDLSRSIMPIMAGLKLSIIEINFGYVRNSFLDGLIEKGSFGASLGLFKQFDWFSFRLNYMISDLNQIDNEGLLFMGLGFRLFP